MKPKIGIIGGSGLYSMPGFEAQEEHLIDTPWGAPSDAYVVGKLAGKEVAFLARHGRGHRHLAVGAEFSREHLRHEIAGRGADSFAERGGIAEGRTSSRWIS